MLALLLALGSTVYAAHRINGRSIRARSIPGNRLRPRSVAANRLRPGVLGVQFRGPLTGADIEEGTLGTVPSAVHAQSADTARSAIESETAVNAVNAVNAQTVNGFGAGCATGTRRFAGACWEASSHGPSTAPAAAVDCAARGGALPEALQLAAFAGQAGVSLDSEGEWSSDIISFTSEDAYAVATVSPNGVVGSGVFDAGGSSDTRNYRCVIPLVS
jgi:hypothetical protein